MILAIDPGSKGALAYALGGADAPHGLVSLANHDVVQLFLRLQAISHLAPSDEKRISYIEENSGYLAGVPRTGASMFTFGKCTGHAEMALAALGFELRRVRPRAWQKAIGAPSKRPGEAHSAFKARLATFARERCPQLNARIDRSNADALLILLYGLKELDKTPIIPFVSPEQPITTIHDNDPTTE